MISNREIFSALGFLTGVLMAGCATTSNDTQTQRYSFEESPSQIAKYLQGEPLHKAGQCVDVMAQVRKQAVMNNSPLGTQRLLKTKNKNFLANEVDRYTQYHAAWKAYFEANATEVAIKENKTRQRKRAIVSGLRMTSDAIAPKRYKGTRKSDELKSDPVAECAIPVVRAKKQLLQNDLSNKPMSRDETIAISKGLLK